MSKPLQTRRTSRVPRRKKFDDNWVVDHVLPSSDPNRSPSAISTSSSAAEGISGMVVTPVESQQQHLLPSQHYQSHSHAYQQHPHSQHLAQLQQSHQAMMLESEAEFSGNVTPSSRSEAAAFVMPHRASNASITSIESSSSKVSPSFDSITQPFQKDPSIYKFRNTFK